MRAKKRKGKLVEQKLLTLKIPVDLHRKWKVQAAREETTMSEIAEKLVEGYLKAALLLAEREGRSERGLPARVGAAMLKKVKGVKS